MPRTSGLVALLCKTDPPRNRRTPGSRSCWSRRCRVHGLARPAQARLQGRRVVRAALRRLPRAGRRPARRRRGQGLQPDDDRARDGSDPGRRPGDRRRPGGVRRRPALRPGPPRVRRADLAAPVGRQPAGRHGDPDHRRPAAQLPRRRLHRLRPAGRHGGRDGEAVLLGDGGQGHASTRSASMAGTDTRPSSTSSATTATRR